MLVTGAKRDIALLDRVVAQAGDELTVLDVSLARNAAALKQNLARGATCRYFDHHFPGEIPCHPNLRTFIDTAPDVCTSLLVDRYLDGRRRIWAVVAAFGDNLAAVGRKAAEALDLNQLQIEQLRELGEAINYNSYGESVDDLNYHPADLYGALSRYADPFEFISGEPVFDILRRSYADDMFRAGELAPEFSTSRCAIYVLPDAAWSRRVSGSFGNQLASMHPERAHAILTLNRHGDYTVSVRAPINRPQGSDTLCMMFDTGGGRKAAAGINRLPVNELEHFLDKFSSCFAQVSN